MSSLDLELHLPDEATLSVDALVSDESLPAVVSPPSTANTESRRLASYLGSSDVTGHAVLDDLSIHEQPQRSNVTSFSSGYDSVPSGKIPSKIADQNADIRTKASTANDSLPPAMLGPWPASAKGSILKEKDFPALGAPRANEAMGTNTHPISSKAAALKTMPVAKNQSEKFPESPQDDQGDDIHTNEYKSSKGSDIKSLEQITPDSGSAFFQSKEGTTKTDEVAGVSTFPPLPTPSVVSNGSAAASRGMPKTLRVIPSTKAETRPPSPTATPISSVISAIGRPLQLHRPGTPASEMISDTASITSVSVSISRAGSPPLGKIGTAPVRGTTKSQQRKQRKDALKQETKILAEASKTETEEHAPVIGRKKKQKKEKPPKEANAVSSAAASIEQPKDETLPLPKNNGKQPANYNEDGDSKPDGVKHIHGSKPNPESKKKEVKETSTSLPSSSLPKTVESVDKSLERPQSSPASVFADIKESLWTAALDKLQLLKPVSSSSSKPEHNPSNLLGKRGDCKESSCRCGEMQDADLAALRAGKPVRKQFHTDGSRMLITPHGDCIRGLTPEEEDTFLALQTAIAATAENPAAFVAPRHQPSSGAFSLIKGRAVPNGRPNIFPSTVQPQSQDPIGKLQREDALSYINQYVLPRLSLGATSMGLTKGASTRDSASLNSLAPYFYGPDAAAGVGIYSTPESARAIQDFATPGMSLDEIGKGAAAGSIGNVPLMSVEDAEAALIAAKRETEKLEKGLNLVIKRNRRLLLGA